VLKVVNARRDVGDARILTDGRAREIDQKMSGWSAEWCLIRMLLPLRLGLEEIQEPMTSLAVVQFLDEHLHVVPGYLLGYGF
jgi:hypothetical protein